MTKLEKRVVRIWGHSSDALGLLAVPTLLFTLIVAILAVIFPSYNVFWFGVWCIAGIVQAIGCFWALKIKLKYNLSI